MVPRRRRSAPSYRYLRLPYRGRAWRLPRSLRWLLFGGFLIYYTVNFIFGDKGVVRRLQLERELEMVQVSNTRMGLQKERLLQEVQLKENDPMSLERLAREKYWMVGPKEQVYRFLEDELVPEDKGVEGAAPEKPEGEGEEDLGPVPVPVPVPGSGEQEP